MARRNQSESADPGSFHEIASTGGHVSETDKASGVQPGRLPDVSGEEDPGLDDTAKNDVACTDSQQ